jgi:hypothetical protein
MRSPRSIFAVLALALAASMALVPSSSTARPAAPEAAAPAAERVLAGDAVSKRAEIFVGARVVKRRLRPGTPRQLMLVGIVRPRKGPVNIQRATSCSRQTRTCNFRYFKTVPLRDGRYRAVIDAPPRLRGWVWRAKVGNNVSEAWVTCTKRPAQRCQIPYRR